MKDEDFFCLEAPRVVGQDYVVQYNGQGLQLNRAARGGVPAKSRVLVRETIKAWTPSRAIPAR